MGSVDAVEMDGWIIVVGVCCTVQGEESENNVRMQWATARQFPKHLTSCFFFVAFIFLLDFLPTQSCEINPADSLFLLLFIYFCSWQFKSQGKQIIPLLLERIVNLLNLISGKSQKNKQINKNKQFHLGGCALSEQFQCVCVCVSGTPNLAQLSYITLFHISYASYFSPPAWHRRLGG